MTIYKSLATELIAELCNNEKLSYRRNLGDFSHGEMSILAHLCYCENGACAGAIGESLTMTVPRVSAAISTLQEKGLVTKERDPEDKRKIHIYISREGRLLVDEKKRELEDAVSLLLSHLGEEDAEEYVRITKRINRIAAQVMPAERSHAND